MQRNIDRHCYVERSAPEEERFIEVGLMKGKQGAYAKRGGARLANLDRRAAEFYCRTPAPNGR